jgi:hypothetical protein
LKFKERKKILCYNWHIICDIVKKEKEKEEASILFVGHLLKHHYIATSISL